MVGCAHRSLDCGISLKEPQNVPKFSNFMEDFKFDVDLHNEEGEKERQDEEGQDHHEEEGDEVGGHGCGQYCGQMMTGYGLIFCDLLHLLLWGRAVRTTWIQLNQK